jgi:xylulokinase
MALLGIDLGSSNCKAVVFNEEGGVLSKTALSYPPLLRPEYGTAEMPPEVFFNVFLETIRSINPEIRSGIDALAVGSHGESYVPLDAAGNPVGNFIMNSDNRAVEESSLLEKELGRDYLYHVCGIPPHHTFSLTKIFWHKRRNLYNNAVRFLSAGDYIVYRLGLGFFTDYSLACRFMGFDINTRQWSEDILEAAAVKTEQFPVPVQAGTEIGKLPKDAALMLGLKLGIPVCAGGHDQPCGALGMGILNRGEAMVSAGTYECVAVSSPLPYNNSRAMACHLNSYCHVIPDKYITLAFFPGAMIIDWLVNEFFAPEISAAKEQRISPYALLDSAMEKIPGPTGVCLTPHLIGSFNPDWDIRAKMVIAGLRPESTRLHLYKAAYEGIACELAQNIEVLEELTGPLDSLRISGGGAKPGFAVSLRAALSGRPVTKMPSLENVCLGAAILAGMGSGVFRNYVHGVESMVPGGEVTEPDFELKKEYEIQKRQYNLLLPSLRQYWAQS